VPRKSPRPQPSLDLTAPCPCGLGPPYLQCCGVFHRGEAFAPTAELLMRSRYSAFAVRDEAYLLRTWHHMTRAPRVWFDDDETWLRLEILGTTAGSAFHTEGTVEFRAHFSNQGRLDSIYENSRFVREHGRWVYLDEAFPALQAL
jgi:SEC-C motif domain protein